MLIGRKNLNLFIPNRFEVTFEVNSFCQQKSTGYEKF